jgi:hypothetical protein
MIYYLLLIIRTEVDSRKITQKVATKFIVNHLVIRHLIEKTKRINGYGMNQLNIKQYEMCFSLI